MWSPTPNKESRLKGIPQSGAPIRAPHALIHLCSEKADFDKDPEKYVPRYSGFCAYAVVSGVLMDVEYPDAFTVYK